MSDTRPKPEDFKSLYRRAFQEFGASALWSSKPVPDPTPEDARAITHGLRVEGNRDARQTGRGNRKSLPCRSLGFKRIFFGSWPRIAIPRATSPEARR
jgi:hypothetical protein